MSKNISAIPFTEIIERSRELAREREDVESKIRGVVNDVYVRDIPSKEDWNFLIARTSMTFTPEYNTGTVSANTDSGTLTFSSDVTTDSSMTNRKVKINSNDYPYDVLGMSGTTGLTVTPNFNGLDNVSGQSYSIFQPFYPLASDFDRFPKNGGLHLFKGGRKKVIPERDYQGYTDDFSVTPNDNQDFCRVIGKNTADQFVLEVIPPPKNKLTSEYDYYRRLLPMRETTAGFIAAVSAGNTVVSGSAGTTLFTEARTGDYFRIDAFGTGNDSEWYRILAINHNSSITLATAFGLSGATTAGYTICSAPEIPIQLHPAILYGTLTQLAADQNDPLTEGYGIKYASILSDGKRIYKTRVYSQEVGHIAEEYNYRR